MKTNIAVVMLAALTSVLVTIACVPPIVEGAEPMVIRETFTMKEPTLSPAQVIWLAKLMQCESGIKANAVNPNDLDNTPSYGILQFKPSTYEPEAAKLGLSDDYMDPNGQVTIVSNWIIKGGIDWTRQFPACVKKLGLPPSSI